MKETTTPVTALEGGHLLAPYLPRLAVEWLSSSPDQRYKELPGTIAFVDALELFAAAIEEMDDIGSRGDALEASARMAECLLVSGDAPAALAFTDRCLELAQALGGVPPQTPLIYRVRGAALASSGAPEAAIESLTHSLVAARGVAPNTRPHSHCRCSPSVSRGCGSRPRRL